MTADCTIFKAWSFVFLIALLTVNFTKSSFYGNQVETKGKGRQKKVKQKCIMRKHLQKERWPSQFEIAKLAQYSFFVWLVLNPLMHLVEGASCLSCQRHKPQGHEKHRSRAVCTDKQLSLG